MKKAKAFLSLLLAVLLLVSAVPAGGFVGLSAPVANAEQTSPEELLAWFNDNVNRLKSDDFSQTVTIIRSELTETRYTNITGSDVLVDVLEDECTQKYSLRKNQLIYEGNFPVFDENFVSALTVGDLQSIQVTETSDVDFLQDLPDTIQSGQNYYDLSLYKKVPVPGDMIRVEISLPAEAVEDGVYTVGDESVSANEIMPSGRFIQTVSLRELYELYPSVSEENADGMYIYSKSDCNSIERNGSAVWYFDKETLAPIACKYIHYEEQDQHMYCKLDIDYGGSYSLDADVKDTSRCDYIYLFSDYYQISVNTTTDGFQYVVVADKAIIVDYNGSATDLAIPSVIDGYPVTSISYAAFRNCTKLQSVEIPRGITSIGNAAFHNCTKLQSVEIPRGVTSIADYAFYGCTELEAISIPLGVTNIGDYAFYDCTALGAISIPQGVTNIGDYAFYDCTALEEISIPQGVTNIGDYAFYDCTALEEISIPQGVTSIGNYTFYGCTALTEIDIMQGVTVIGDYAFHDCTVLEEISIPQGVTSIGEYAFNNCTSLTSVTVPDSVTSCGEYAFSGCNSLTAVHISDIAAWCGIAFEDSYSNPLNYAENLYLSGELVTDIVIPNGVTSIGNYAFIGCVSLTSVTVPNSVTSIGNYAFIDCSSLTSVTVPDSVTSIGFFAFYSDASLANITILNPDCVIYDAAFTIPDTATIYGYENSTAKSYARKYSRTFVSLGALPEEPTEPDDPDQADNGGVSLEAYWQLGQNGIVAVDIYIDNASNLQLNALNLSLSYDESVFSIKDENPPEFDEPFYSIVQILSNFTDFDISEAWKINTETDGTVTVTTSFLSLFPTIIKSLDSQGLDSDHIRLATIYLSMNDKSDSGKEFAISANGNFFITNSETPNPVSATIRKTLCEHQWDNGTITQEAKCETNGVKTYTCMRDASHTYTEEIAATGHTEEEIPAVPATCTEGGLTAGVKCSVCDAIFTEQQPIEALGHDEIAHDAQVPTCTEIGWDAYVTCSRCDYTTYEELEALGHDEIAHDAQAPTCTEIGWDAYVTCSRCDYTTYEELEALGHDKIAHDAQAPACTEIGWDAYVTCSRCDYTTYEELEALGHDEIAHDAQAPTCTEIGWDAYVTCSRCDYTTYEELEALGHDEIAHDAQAPTCTEIGWDAYVTCSRCDYTTYEEKTALGHDEIAHDAQAPTCTEIGWDAYVTCSRCDYTTYEELEALGHDEIAHDAQAPTCIAIGWDAYVTCSRCDFTTYKEKAALGHSHKTVVTAPTVTNKGYTTYTCVCGDSYVQDYVDPVAGDNAVMKEESVVGLAGTTAKTLLEQVTVGAKLFGMDSKEKAVDARIGTGDKLVLPDGTEMILAVLGDINGDGVITTADARLALRKAVNLETFTDAQNTAADADGIDAVTVADARKILRASVNLEKAEDWFKALSK